MNYLIPVCTLSCISFLFLPLLSYSTGNGDSAKVALAALKIQRGTSIAGHVTNVRGHRGQDQPTVWEVTSRISDGERVFVIRQEKIVADTMYSSGGGITVDLRRLKIDSVEVFQVANRAAIKANVGFDSVDYELIAAPLGNAPLWIIHLRDFQGHDVGKLEVSGESSELLRIQWFEPRSVARQPIGPDDDDRKSVLQSYTPILRGDNQRSQGRNNPAPTFARKTGNKIKQGFKTIGNEFTRIFGKQAKVSTGKPRRQVPATSRKSPGA